MTDPTALPVDVVGRWLAAQGTQVVPPLRAEVITGGRSNLTYLLSDAAGARWVLRRPPMSGVIASAHDVLREHRIMAALEATAVPVPRMVAACEDTSVLSVPFFVMQYVAGVVPGDQELAEQTLDLPAHAALGPHLVDVLAGLHAVTPSDVGLADLGKGTDYVTRQLTRWERQLDRLGVPATAAMREVLIRLRDGAPEQRDTTIVHGDFRPGNVIVGEAGQVRAVLDWELATLGDPLADVGWLLAYWGEPGDGVPLPSPTRGAGFTRRDDLATRYAETTGRPLDDLAYYLAFALWRMAAILAGVNARARQGAYGAVSVDVADRWVEQLTDAARAAAQAAGR
ncbi:MAG TPA: phosphotransferase family protein [Jatrophihabitantaceae bacterium]|nr:phosphotransferase family protein [Jatrophihabitantaceae bacterium]